MHPGSEFRAHLRDPIELGPTLVATAGTPARLIVTANDGLKEGTPRLHIAILGINLGVAGTLPVKAQSPVVERVSAGMPIPATTLAAIAFEEGKVRVAIPLPLKLSNEPPNGGYTPAPLRTAAPILQRRKPAPSPSPVTAPTPDPNTPASPAASATPSPLPS